MLSEKGTKYTFLNMVLLSFIALAFLLISFYGIFSLYEFLTNESVYLFIGKVVVIALCIFMFFFGGCLFYYVFDNLIYTFAFTLSLLKNKDTIPENVTFYECIFDEWKSRLGNPSDTTLYRYYKTGGVFFYHNPFYHYSTGKIDNGNIPDKIAKTLKKYESITRWRGRQS